MQIDKAQFNLELDWDPFKYSSENFSSIMAGLTCIQTDSRYERWIQTLGFQKWSKHNCEYLFTSTFLTACSIIKTNGVEERRNHDNETGQINDDSNYENYKRGSIKSKAFQQT